MVFKVVLAVVIILITSVYLFYKRKYSYWSRRNVPSPKATIPYGNLEGLKSKNHYSQLVTKFYNQMKGNGLFCGLYFLHSPVLLVTDLGLVKNMLIKDFNSFQERGIYYNEKDDPLSAHLFSVNFAKWKGLRNKLTPTFTSGKMKFMFPTIVAVGDEFQKVLSTMIHDGEELEMKELLARFTTDVIGTCAFGIECNSLKDPNAQFRAMGRKVFDGTGASVMRQIFMQTFKNFAKRLRMKSIPDEISDFFLRIVRETVEQRERNNIQRNDFMDLLIEIKNKGRLDDTQLEKVTLEEIAAQAFVFFLAGFETSSTTLSWALFELSQRKDIQSKAREEIKTVLQKHGGQFTYEAMMDMHYIDHVLNESLRKYPPVARIMRMATKEYNVPDTNMTIDKNTNVMIPIYAIHHDPEIYEDPQVFKPERFEPAAVQARPSCSFLPFGEGPRNCIGLRFGMMQSRIGLVTLLRHFEIDMGQKTQLPLEFFPSSPVLAIKGGLHLTFKKIDIGI